MVSVCLGRNSCRNVVSSSRFESGLSHHAVDGLGEALKASTITKLTKELQHERPLEVLTMDWCITQDKTLQRFDADEVEANAPRIKRARVDLRARWGDQLSCYRKRTKHAKKTQKPGKRNKNN